MAPSPEATGKLIQKVLRDSYLDINVAGVAIDDDMHGGCGVHLAVDGQDLVGGGVGAVDAVFDALKSHYVTEYESLGTIELSDFKVTLSGKRARRMQSGVAGTDSYCECNLWISNSYGTTFDFTASDCSLAAAVARVIALGVQHFINAERAYIALHRAYEDAKERNRTDLASRYLAEMSEIVKSTSYASVLERISQKVEK